MELILRKKPKSPTLIEAFPGVGLIGSIATEYLINHLDCEEIGQIVVDLIAPIVAIHEGKLIKPISIYYSKKYNLVFIHSIAPVSKVEWRINTLVHELIKTLQIKNVISIDGVMSKQDGFEKVYYYTNSKTFLKKLEKTRAKEIKESIVMGVTATLLSTLKINFLGLFAETHLELPDSRAAARIIESLDQILGLKVDYKPLIKKAENFEEKLKGLMEQGKLATDMQEQKQVNYFG